MYLGGEEMKTRFNLSIDRELLQAIKIKAIKEDKNLNEIIEKLIEIYLKENENGNN